MCCHGKVLIPNAMITDSTAAMASIATTFETSLDGFVFDLPAGKLTTAH